MATKVSKVEDLGDDRLRVTGTVEGATGPDGEPVEVVASGWVSAMTNHYDAEHYDAEGQLVEGATSREMTDDEKHAYWVALLEAAAPRNPEPTTLYIKE